MKHQSNRDGLDGADSSVFYPDKNDSQLSVFVDMCLYSLEEGRYEEVFLDTLRVLRKSCNTVTTT